MPRGGHSRSGPPPDPNALRRERKSDKVTFLRLPATREGDAPAWPLTKARARELSVWRREWARPQAYAWELYHLEVEVAVYVRTLCEAELPGSTAQLRILLRQQMDALGLTVPGLARNRWVIPTDDADLQADDDTPERTEAPATSARERLRLIATS